MPSDDKSLKEIAREKNSAAPSQLGDPVSLKPETVEHSPTEYDKPNKAPNKIDQQGKSLKQMAQDKMETNPSQIGDPVSLKAETSHNEPTEQDRGALGTGRDEKTGQPLKSKMKDNLQYYEDIYGTRVEGAFDETHDTGSDDDESPSPRVQKEGKARKQQVRPSKKRKLSGSRSTQERKGSLDTDDAVSTGDSVPASVDSQITEAAAKRLRQRQTVDRNQQSPFGRRGRGGRMNSDMAAPASSDDPSSSQAYEVQDTNAQMLDHMTRIGSFTDTVGDSHGLVTGNDGARVLAGNETMDIVQGQELSDGLATTSAPINMPAKPIEKQLGVNNGGDAQAREDGHVDDETGRIDVVFDEDPGYAGDAEEVQQGTDAIAPPETGRRGRGLQEKSMNDEVQNDSRELVNRQPPRRGRPRKVESLAKELSRITSASEESPAVSRHNTRAEKKRAEALESERRELQRLAARPKTRGFKQGHDGFFARFAQPKEKEKEKGKGQGVVAVKSKRNKMTARQATLHTKAKKKGIAKRVERPKAQQVKRLNWKGQQMQLVREQGHVVVPRG
ncbi:hypothetical protein KC332_g16986 [Hortaea werneckii]|nr:hypothetical protein KC358_g18677 [Hortaea werneckii]KAI6899558.1 hypothetical protein KC348_g17104 [Hortaea werneckii]KAI6919737.1 hypothetical protein KC341_g17071 [Hortaea werneckii]KAI6953246.1 hypothetical protein KC321_g17077 [Hortaea werneckii]KAI6960051.1 hypothetical protein KC329_g17162 [Hortaea werneckii]